jgi:hypothetical protein
MAKAPHPAANLALKEPVEDDEENLGYHGPKDRDRAEPEVRALTDEDLEPGWFTMDSAPTTGKAVRLVGLLPPGVPAECPAYMHNSRRYTGSATRWQNFAEWRILNTPTAIPFEPLAWSRFE